MWAAGEIEKRTNGRYHIDVFPASSLGKESDINQGLTLGTVDMIISGLSFARARCRASASATTRTRSATAITWSSGRRATRSRSSPTSTGKKTGIQITAMTYYGTRHTTSNKPFTDCAGMKGLKMRVPDVPAYLALPKALRREPDADRVRRGLPRAAERHRRRAGESADDDRGEEVLRSAEVDHPDRPHRRLARHPIAPHVWTKLSDADKKIFTDVTQEAAQKATAEITKHEGELVDEFKKKGLTVIAVDKKSFQDAIKKAVSLESMGYQKADWDKIQAIK